MQLNTTRESNRQGAIHIAQGRLSLSGMEMDAYIPDNKLFACHCCTPLEYRPNRMTTRPVILYGIAGAGSENTPTYIPVQDDSGEMSYAPTHASPILPLGQSYERSTLPGQSFFDDPVGKASRWYDLEYESKDSAEVWKTEYTILQNLFAEINQLPGGVKDAIERDPESKQRFDELEELAKDTQNWSQLPFCVEESRALDDSYSSYYELGLTDDQKEEVHVAHKRLLLWDEFLDPKYIQGAVRYVGPEQYIEIDWSTEASRLLLGPDYHEYSRPRPRSDRELRCLYGDWRSLIRRFVTQGLVQGALYLFNKNDQPCHSLMRDLAIMPDSPCATKYNTNADMNYYGYLDCTLNMDTSGINEIEKLCICFASKTPDGKPVPRHDMIMLLIYD